MTSSLLGFGKFVSLRQLIFYGDGLSQFPFRFSQMQHKQKPGRLKTQISLGECLWTTTKQPLCHFHFQPQSSILVSIFGLHDGH